MIANQWWQWGEAELNHGSSIPSFGWEKPMQCGNMISRVYKNFTNLKEIVLTLMS